MLLGAKTFALLSIPWLLLSTLTLGAPLPQADASGLGRRDEGPRLGIRQDPVPPGLGLEHKSILSYSAFVQPEKELTDRELIALTRKAYLEMSLAYEKYKEDKENPRIDKPSVMASLEDEKGRILFASSVTTSGGGAWEKYIKLGREIKKSPGYYLKLWMNQNKNHQIKGLCGEINVLRLHSEIQLKGVYRNAEWKPPTGARVVAWDGKDKKKAISFCGKNLKDQSAGKPFGCRQICSQYDLKEVLGDPVDISKLTFKMKGFTRDQTVRTHTPGFLQDQTEHTHDGPGSGDGPQEESEQEDEDAPPSNQEGLAAWVAEKPEARRCFLPNTGGEDQGGVTRRRALPGRPEGHGAKGQKDRPTTSPAGKPAKPNARGRPKAEAGKPGNLRACRARPQGPKDNKKPTPAAQPHESLTENPKVPAAGGQIRHNTKGKPKKPAVDAAGPAKGKTRKPAAGKPDKTPPARPVSKAPAAAPNSAIRKSAAGHPGAAGAIGGGGKGKGQQ